MYLQTFGNQASQCSPYIVITATTILAMSLGLAKWISHDTWRQKYIANHKILAMIPMFVQFTYTYCDNIWLAYGKRLIFV